MVAETVYGLLRWERRIEAIVEEILTTSRGRREIVSAMARQELKLLVYEARNGVPVDALRADARRLAGRELDLDMATFEYAGLAGRDGADRDGLRRTLEGGDG